MNRRGFLRALGIGAVSAPTLAAALAEDQQPAKPVAEKPEMLTTTIHVNGDMGLDPAAIVEAIKRFERRNGKEWRA